MTTTTPVPAAQRLRVAQAALADARVAFLREAADTVEGDRLDWLYATAAELRQLAERVAEVLR
jgi:site-specific recombinase